MQLTLIRRFVHSGANTKTDSSRPTFKPFNPFIQLNWTKNGKNAKLDVQIRPTDSSFRHF